MNKNDKKSCCKNNCSENYEVTVEEEKAKVDPSKPCDESNPDYPWVSCGVNKKAKIVKKNN